MSVLELSLVVAAVLIGLTGAWSPCGFSMVETIGIAGDGGRRWTTIAACATFVPGAVIGGVVTFGSLSALGETIHGAGGRLAYLAAAAIAIAAAIAEARGMRIVPQIRRQLPEGWRWTMPLPLASALYGILLGLGFTTFVLSFGVWALAGISVALGDPQRGSVDRRGVRDRAGDPGPGGRPGRGHAARDSLHRADGGAAGPLPDLPAGGRANPGLGGGSAHRQHGDGVANRGGQRLRSLSDRKGTGLPASRSATAVLRFRGQLRDLPGRDPAVGGPYAAVISGGEEIQILNRASLDPIGSVSAPNAESLAISRGWLVYLTADEGRYKLRGRRLRYPSDPGKVKGIASVSRPVQLGHPSLDGGRLLYTVSRPRGNAIKRRSLGSGKSRTVLRSRSDVLLNPSVQGKRLIYVRVDRARQSPQKTSPPKLRQRLMLRRLRGHGSGRRIYSHGPDRTVWSTSLSGKRGFVTLFRGGGPKIVSVQR